MILPDWPAWVIGIMFYTGTTVWALFIMALTVTVLVQVYLRLS